MKDKISIVLRDIGAKTYARFIVEVNYEGYDFDKAIESFSKKCRNLIRKDGQSLDIYIGVWATQASYTIPLKLVDTARLLSCPIYIDFND